MSRRRRRTGAGTIVRAVREQGDRIVAAIQKASNEARASREGVIAAGAELLRAALQEGAERAVVVNPGTGRSVQFSANDTGAAASEPEEPAPPTTPRGAPANDAGPPESGPRK